jgi:hypothetical protein
MSSIASHKWVSEFAGWVEAFCETQHWLDRQELSFGFASLNPTLYDGHFILLGCTKKAPTLAHWTEMSDVMG